MSRAALLLMGWLLLVSVAEAQDPGYRPYERYREDVQALTASRFATAEVLATTATGREVVVIRVGSGAMDGRPGLVIVGGEHGPHLVGSELALRLAEALVERAEDDAAWRKHLQEVTYYILPRPAPDAAEALFEGRAERTGNARPTDTDRDGRLDEDPGEDLNGDGHLTVMRVADPTGSYLPHPSDPRVLIAADPKKGEQGRFRLLPEGIDNDRDGAFNEDGPGGVAFDRSFPHGYAPFTPEAGPHAASEPEVRAVLDFLYDRTNIALVFCFTPRDNLFHVWKPDKRRDGDRIKTRLHSTDAPYLHHLAARYREVHGGTDAPASPAGPGAFPQWAYFHYGRWTFAARGWWIPAVKADDDPEGKDPVSAIDAGDRGKKELNALRWAEGAGIEGFVEWTPVQHPDFPEQTVEVGGFLPFWRLNPPAEELPRLTEVHLAFLDELAAALPRIELDGLRVEPLGAGLFRVSVRVLNTGYLPTMPEMGRIARTHQRLQVELSLPEGGGFLVGPGRRRVPPLAGRGGHHEVSWVVRLEGSGEGQLRAWSPSVGAVSLPVPLR